MILFSKAQATEIFNNGFTNLDSVYDAMLSSDIDCLQFELHVREMYELRDKYSYATQQLSFAAVNNNDALIAEYTQQINDLAIKFVTLYSSQLDRARASVNDYIKNKRTELLNEHKERNENLLSNFSRGLLSIEEFTQQQIQAVFALELKLNDLNDLSVNILNGFYQTVVEE